MPITRFGKFLNQFDGMREAGNNRGVFIDRANKRYAYLGAPYCASAMSYSIDLYNETHNNNQIRLKTRSGRARAFITSESISALAVFYNRISAPDNSLLIYVRTGGGHIAYRDSGSNQRSINFHFNSSPGTGGSQWNGRWSGWKRENLQKLCSPLNAFRVTDITPLQL